jgi:hypothetical protein
VDGGDACACACPTIGSCDCARGCEPERRDPLFRAESAGGAVVSGGVTSCSPASLSAVGLGAETSAVGAVDFSVLVEEAALESVWSASEVEEVDPVDDADAASEEAASVSDVSAEATPFPVATATPSPTATAATDDASKWFGNSIETAP